MQNPHEKNPWQPQDQLTIRDVFAVSAMQGIIVKHAESGKITTKECVSEMAYEMADAMLNERNKPTKGKK